MRSSLFAFETFVVCLCVLLLRFMTACYLTIRFTYFLNWLLLALFPGPKPFLLLFGSINTDIYKLPWRTQSITTIDTHCSKRVDLYPGHQLKSIAFLPQCLLCSWLHAWCNWWDAFFLDEESIFLSPNLRHWLVNGNVCFLWKKRRHLRVNKFSIQSPFVSTQKKTLNK